MEEEADRQADDRRADPAEADAGEGQDIAHGFDQTVQMQQGAEIFGEVAEQVVDGADERQDQGGDVDLPAVAKELAEEGQQDQGDGQGIEEHQHGHGVADDGAQAQVGKDEGHEAEHDGPDPVRGPLGEEADEGLAAAGDEGHGHIVHAVKAQVLQKRRSGALPRPGHAGNNNKFHPFAPLFICFTVL